MLPKIKGKVAYVFDQPDFDVDLICGLSNYTVTDPQKLKELCMQDIDPTFRDWVEPGDVVICARNFGYGHPHIGGPVGLAQNGITAIIAESFCPGFYRANSHRGFPLIECENLLQEVKKGDRVEFDWDTCQLHLLDSGKTLQCKKIPQKSIQLIEVGGIYEFIKQRVQNEILNKSV